MFKKNIDSYQEIKALHPKWRKYSRLGFVPSYWAYRVQWHIVERFHYITRFPIHIDIETCNVCNLKCVMCPHSVGTMDNPGFIDFELVKGIVDEGSRYGLKSLKLNIRGEPLLHQGLEDMVAYAKKKNILEVMFNTNAMLLTPERTRGLIAAGLDYIIISIDGATKQTYENIRIGADFETVCNNIRFLSEYRSKNKLKKPLIRLQFVKMKENVHELPLYIEQWKDYVDVMTANDYSNRVNTCIERTTRQTLPYARANCPHPWRRLSVTSSGNILMCCGDWYERGTLGNIRKDSIYDIWHGDEMNTRRALLKAAELDKIPSCKDCFVLASYKWRKT